MPTSHNCMPPNIKVSVILYIMSLSVYNRKGLIQKPVNFIHLNLSISLLAALALFVGGIETATSIPVMIVCLKPLNLCIHFAGTLHNSHCSYALFLPLCIFVDVL